MKGDNKEFLDQLKEEPEPSYLVYMMVSEDSFINKYYLKSMVGFFAEGRLRILDPVFVKDFSDAQKFDNSEDAWKLAREIAKEPPDSNCSLGVEPMIFPFDKTT